MRLCREKRELWKTSQIGIRSAGKTMVVDISEAQPSREPAKTVVTSANLLYSWELSSECYLYANTIVEALENVTSQPYT